MAIRSVAAAAALLGLSSIAVPQKIEPEQAPEEYTCPMDRDIRSVTATKCPRCGMKLIPGTADFIEYPLDLRIAPARYKPGQPVSLLFTVRDPVTHKPVRAFDVVHEKLFHVFLVSQDLSFFAHEHPEPMRDGRFALRTVLPKAGAYRVACDFYPSSGTPQLIAKTIFTPGSTARPVPRLEPDTAGKSGANLDVSLTLEPAEPIAGQKTMLFFQLNPGDGLEPYLGAQGHMLVASPDLVDVIHTHPAWPDPGTRLQFNVLFPREGVHRVWVQFQRKGVVNTVAFNVPVKELR